MLCYAVLCYAMLCYAMQVPAVMIASGAALAARGDDRPTALVVELLEEMLAVTPVYEGHALAHATVTFALGAFEFDEWMLALLRESGYALMARMLCYAMLCYAVLRYATLCYAMLCHAML